MKARSVRGVPFFSISPYLCAHSTLCTRTVLPEGPQCSVTHSLASLRRARGQRRRSHVRALVSRLRTLCLCTHRMLCAHITRHSLYISRSRRHEPLSRHNSAQQARVVGAACGHLGSRRPPRCGDALSRRRWPRRRQYRAVRRTARTRWPRIGLDALLPVPVAPRRLCRCGRSAGPFGAPACAPHAVAGAPSPLFSTLNGSCWWWRTSAKAASATSASSPRVLAW